MSVDYVGRFEALGFDEPEPGLIPDTQENRQRLIEMKWSWIRDVDEDGEFTGLLHPRTAEQVTEARTEVANKKRHTLSDESDAWSDFKHPNDLDVDLPLPTWVRSRLRKWRADEADGIPERERRPFPTRCETFRFDGTRCWNWVNRPEDNRRCSHHSNLNKTALRTAAAYSRQQLIDLLPGAVDNVAYLAFNAEGEAVKLKANTEIMDRAGLRAGVEIDLTAEVTHVDPGQALQDRLTKLAKRHAEQITEEPDGPPPPALEPAEVVEAEIIEETA